MRLFITLLCCLTVTPALAQGVAYNNDVTTQLNTLATIQKQQSDLLQQMQALRQQLEDIKKVLDQQQQILQQQLAVQRQQQPQRPLRPAD